jgi:beta-mannosidase
VLIVSDRWEEVSGSAQLTWYDWRGTPLNTSTHEFTVPTLNNSLVFEAMGLNRILPTGENATDVWLHLTLTAEVDSRTVTNEQVVNFFNLHLLLCF